MNRFNLKKGDKVVIKNNWSKGEISKYQGEALSVIHDFSVTTDSVVQVWLSREDPPCGGTIMGSIDWDLTAIIQKEDLKDNKDAFNLLSL